MKRGMVKKGIYTVLILGGNSKIGAHVRSNLCYLTCLGKPPNNKVLFLMATFFGGILLELQKKYFFS